MLTLPKLSAATQTRQQAVHGIIENEILELRIAPGSRLVEAELVSHFGVSKTPIREAFLILEQQSLIKLVPYAGARVNMLSFAEYVHIVSLIDQVEIPALEAVVANARTEDLARPSAHCRASSMPPTTLGDGETYRKFDQRTPPLHLQPRQEPSPRQGARAPRDGRAPLRGRGDPPVRGHVAMGVRPRSCPARRHPARRAERRAQPGAVGARSAHGCGT